LAQARTEEAILQESLHNGDYGRSQRFSTWYGRVVDAVLNTVVDPAAAAILLFEVCLLAVNVFARYVMHNALTWGDELAVVLFLWMTMLGATSAFRRNEHMRLSALTSRLRPRAAEICDILNTVLIVIFTIELLIAVVWPSFIPEGSSLAELLKSVFTGDFFASAYFGQEFTDLLPAMQIPRAIATGGIVFGVAMMLLIALCRLAETDRALTLKIVAVVLAACVLVYLGRGFFHGLGNANLVLFFVVFVAVEIAIGMPIAFAFGIATLNYLGVVTDLPLSVIAGQMDQGMSNQVLLAVPLFVLLGLLIENAGIAKRLIEAISAFCGHLRGGLNIVLVVAMFLVSGISGSKLADMAAVAPVLFPEMERRGYARSEMIALLSTSGAMAELIPPSLVLIIMGTVCNLSIQSLFTAGLLPAALASVALVVVSHWRSRGVDYLMVPRTPWAARGKALWVALPGLVLPLIIRYFVVEGIATATEVSTIGVIYTLIVGVFVYREFEWRRMYPMLRETARLTGAIMLIISMATAMGWALTQSGFAATLSEILSHASGGAPAFLALSIILFIVLGSVLEGVPAIVLFGPLLFPIAERVGVNEIHYAIVTLLAMSIGLFAPPFGVGYYGACAVGKCEPDAAALAIVPYVLALLLSVIVIAAVPWISTGFL
jgi:tripartite ATP-independent transporter DctM subunit